MKIHEALKREIVTVDNQEGVLAEGMKRTYATGKDVWPKTTITIEYPIGADMTEYFGMATAMIKSIEHKDQLPLPLEEVDKATGEVSPSGKRGKGWRKD